MNLIQRIKAVIMPTQSDPGNKYNQSLFSYFNGIFFNIPNNPRAYVANGYQGNPDVYSIINMIAKKAASVPFYVYVVNNKKSFNRVKNNKFNLLKKGLDEVEGTDLNRLIERPNEMQSQQEYIEALVSFLEITGNAYSYKFMPEVGRNKGVPTKLYPLPSHLTEIKSGGALQPIESYRVMLNDWNKSYKSEDVLLLSNHSFDYTLNGSQLYGTSKVRAALQEIDTYKYAKERELYSYQTGDAQTIMFPKDMEVSNTMNDEDNKTIVQEWIDKVRKMLKQKDRSNISVSPYGLDAIKIGTALKDTNTTESKDSAIAAICGVWHINPIILGHNSTNTDGKIKEVTKMALRDTVFPEAKDLLQGMNDFWMSTYKERGENLELGIDFDCYEEFNQDILATANALSKLDVLSDNEKRTDFLNYDALEDERAKTPQKYWDIQLDPMDLNYENNPSVTE